MKCYGALKKNELYLDSLTWNYPQSVLLDEQRKTEKNIQYDLLNKTLRKESINVHQCIWETKNMEKGEKKICIYEAIYFGFFGRVGKGKR